MVTCTGHIGIHEGADGRTYVRTYVVRTLYVRCTYVVRTLYVRCTYVVRTDVHDVMAIKPNFLTSMGYHIFLTMVLRARAPSARAELRYNIMQFIHIDRHYDARNVLWLLTSSSHTFMLLCCTFPPQYGHITALLIQALDACSWRYFH